MILEIFLIGLGFCIGVIIQFFTMQSKYLTLQMRIIKLEEQLAKKEMAKIILKSAADVAITTFIRQVFDPRSPHAFFLKRRHGDE